MSDRDLYPRTRTLRVIVALNEFRAKRGAPPLITKERDPENRRRRRRDG